MIQPAVAAALLAVAGGVVAVSARESRLVALGLLLAMVAAPLASSPEPSSLTIAFRFVGGGLAAYLLWAAARSQSISSEGSGVGVAAELALAAAAFSIGWFVAPVKPLAGPTAAQAAGFALVALAVAPLAGRDVFRVGTGVAVMALGISLLLQAWAAPASSLQQIALTALFVGVLGATSLLIAPAERTSTRWFGPRPVARAEQAGGDESIDGTADSSSGDTGSRGSLGTSPAAAPTRTRTRAPSQAAASATPAAPAQPEPSLSDSPASNRARRLHPREPRR